MGDIAKLLLLVFQGVEAILQQQQKEERQRRVEAIRNDPITEWNRRFKRVPKPSHKEGELPPNHTNSSPRND